MSRFIQNRELLMSYLRTHPFLVESSNAVKPENIPGDYKTVALYAGKRMWCFLTEDERNRFCRKYTSAKKMVSP